MTYFYSFVCLSVFVLNRYYADWIPLDFYNLIYAPDRSGFLVAMAAAFLHFGYFHLIGNLVYLLIIGRYVEDRMGPVLFTLLFLSSSLVGNIFQGLFNSYVLHETGIGIIGASGAISGILGAFAVRFYSNRLKVAYWVFLPLQAYNRLGSAEIPALFAVALWFVLQLVQSLLQTSGISLNVAYITHLTGFLWGMGLACLLGEHRRAVVETVWRRAQMYLGKGEAYAAQGELLRYISLRPMDIEAYAALARTMVMAGDRDGAVENYRKACEQYLAIKKRGKAEKCFREAVKCFPDFTLSSENHLNIAFGLERNLKPDLAAKAYRNFEKQYPTHKEAPFTLLRMANLLWNVFDQKEDAKTCYTKLIEKYPEDEWVDFAREQVRMLSVDTV